MEQQIFSSRLFHQGAQNEAIHLLWRRWGKRCSPSDWAAPCLPPASHCSILFFKCRGGCRSSTKESRLLTRIVCLSLHAHYWVKQKDLKRKGLARREMLRRVPWSSPAAQPSNMSQSCSQEAAAQPQPSSKQQQRLLGNVCVIQLITQFSLPSHLLLSMTFFNNYAGSVVWKKAGS